jgi:predicted dehydrogenase
MPKNPRAGVVGCGSIGRRYLDWLTQLGCVVGLYDPDISKTKNLSAKILIFSDIDSLLEWAEDYVVIASPPRSHRAPMLSALGRGAKILVEKPLAASLVDAHEMRLAAECAPGRVFAVCNMRFHPAVQALRKQLKQIGEPLYARAHFSHRLAQMRPAGLNVFAADAKEGGGVILDCVHDLDLLVWMLGPMRVVHAWTGQIGPDPIAAEDYAEIHLQSTQGIRVALHLDFLARWKRRGLELAGTDATLVWHSEGRRPETATVYLNRSDHSSAIFDSSMIDPNISYLNMLRSFLYDGRDLQTLQEAEHVLALAHDAGGAVLA